MVTSYDLHQLILQDALGAEVSNYESCNTNINRKFGLVITNLLTSVSFLLVIGLNLTILRFQKFLLGAFRYSYTLEMLTISASMLLPHNASTKL